MALELRSPGAWRSPAPPSTAYPASMTPLGPNTTRDHDIRSGPILGSRSGTQLRARPTSLHATLSGAWGPCSQARSLGGCAGRNPRRSPRRAPTLGCLSPCEDRRRPEPRTVVALWDDLRLALWLAVKVALFRGEYFRRETVGMGPTPRDLELPGIAWTSLGFVRRSTCPHASPDVGPTAPA